MKGNARIAEILQQEYNVKNLTPYEEIEYEIQNFSDEISRVKITSKNGENFCPVYAMFDGYHMSWYGDYGSFVFDCTWKTNVMNLAYNSPYYQLEKLDSRKRHEFNSEKCQELLLQEIKESDWYNDDLSAEQKLRFDDFISDAYDYIYSDDVLCEYETICEELKKLLQATEDEIEWVSAIRNVDDDVHASVFGCDTYELYSLGNKAPVRFFIILYLLSVVANIEREKNNNENKRLD